MDVEKLRKAVDQAGKGLDGPVYSVNMQCRKCPHGAKCDARRSTWDGLHITRLALSELRAELGWNWGKGEWTETEEK